jgi:hypothetical protein
MTRGDEKCSYNFSRKERKHSRDLGVDERKNTKTDIKKAGYEGVD